VATQVGGPARPASKSGAGTTPWARAHVLARGEKNGVRGGDVGGGGRPREKPAAGVRRRFSVGDPVPGGRGGVKARVGIVGHGGGVNLAGGGLERSVRGEVAAPATVRSLVMPTSVIGEGKGARCS
jgi:hypothetical protein